MQLDINSFQNAKYIKIACSRSVTVCDVFDSKTCCFTCCVATSFAAQCMETCDRVDIILAAIRLTIFCESNGKHRHLLVILATIPPFFTGCNLFFIWPKLSCYATTSHRNAWNAGCAFFRTLLTLILETLCRMLNVDRGNDTVSMYRLLKCSNALWLNCGFLCILETHRTHI